MKLSFIIIYLITYSICEVFFLKKYGSITTSDSSGIVFLNAYNFEKNDDIHIVFRANNGQMNKKIYYEFCDDEPTSTFSPKYSLDTTFNDKNSEDDNYNYVKNYYYEIKKKIDKKYLIMKYLNFMTSDNGYLIIENTHFNSNYFIVIIVVAIVILIIVVIVAYIIKVKLKNQESQIVELEKSLTLQKEQIYNNNNTPSDNYQ